MTPSPIVPNLSTLTVIRAVFDPMFVMRRHTIDETNGIFGSNSLRIKQIFSQVS